MKSKPAQPAPRLLRKAEVMARIGLRPTQLHEYINRGEFPRPAKLSNFGRAVGFLESEVTAWIESRIASRDQEIPEK